MYLAYAYYLYHNPTDQYYYGSRYKNVRVKRQPNEDLWIHYFSSSTNIKNLLMNTALTLSLHQSWLNPKVMMNATGMNKI